MQECNKQYNKYTPKILINNNALKQSYLNKMKDVYEKQGLKILVKQMLKKILSPIIITNSAIWFERDLTEELLDYQLDFPVEFETNSIDKTINWLKSQKESWVINQKEITIAYSYNHYWPFVSINGKILGCIKIGLDNVYITDYKQVVKFPKKMAFIYDTFILEAHRGKGIGKFLIAQAIKFLKSRGYIKVRCHIPAWNKISISVYEKMGFRKINYIRFFRIFGIPIRKIKPISKISNIMET